MVYSGQMYIKLLNLIDNHYWQYYSELIQWAQNNVQF